MVSPVQFSNSSKVYFKGNDDVISAPGKFSVPEAEEDVVEISNANADEAGAPAKKKGKAWKAVLTSLVGFLALTGAAWGIYKGKGDKWINKEASTTGEKFKNALAKPGEWIDENIIKKISNKITEWRGKKAPDEDKVDDIIDDVEEVISEA